MTGARAARGLVAVVVLSVAMIVGTGTLIAAMAGVVLGVGWLAVHAPWVLFGLVCVVAWAAWKAAK